MEHWRELEVSRLSTPLGAPPPHEDTIISRVNFGTAGFEREGFRVQGRLGV